MREEPSDDDIERHSLTFVPYGSQAVTQKLHDDVPRMQRIHQEMDRRGVARSNLSQTTVLRMKPWWILSLDLEEMEE